MNEVERYKRCLLRTEQEGGSWESQAIVPFAGRSGQRGFGFGSVFKSFAKLALPFFKRFGKKAVKHALELGSDVVLKNQAPKEALIRRGKALLGDLFSDNLQSGSGYRKRKTALTKWTSSKRLKRI
jgi:hypothetical protein